MRDSLRARPLQDVPTSTSRVAWRRPVKRTWMVLVALGIVACGAPVRSPDTVVMASGSDLESGNPVITVHSLSRQIQRYALFVTLVQFDTTLQPVPYYARQWTWSGDRRQLTFALASNLRWHDGEPTTARDVQFTFDAVRDPVVGSPRASDLLALDSVHVRSDTAVVFHFQQPQARMPDILAEMPLIPRHLLDTVPRTRWRQASFSLQPVGNGPFRFIDRLPNRRWRFERNTAFPLSMGGPPRLHRIVVAVVDEAATKFAGLVSGELDVAGVSPSMAHLVRNDPMLELRTPPALLSVVLAFNTTRAPFNDVRVRQAVSLSIDRARLVAAAVAGLGTPASSAIPPGLPMSRTQRPLHDPARADALLDAAGWTRSGTGIRANGSVPLEVELLTVGSGDLAVEQLLQADLAARGIKVRIRVAEMASFLTTVRAVDKVFDMVVTGIPGDIGLGQLSALFASGQRGGALDYTGFHDRELDALLETARGASPPTAGSSWMAVDSLLQRYAPVAWLYHARGVQGLSRRLQHVTMDLRGELVTLSQWSLQTRD